jgi:hypothetical protein
VGKDLPVFISGVKPIGTNFLTAGNLVAVKPGFPHQRKEPHPKLSGTELLG